ncbi:hypothetical protein [Bordetella sp. 02P26C-1]|uniref:hypothetical protein n=1 Tax=Bordetella sp. 02P26C-1 TaxID=2683195 RepID=UPI0013542D60|nr:hypothetical protein [Bordetella sp. 02P26C-1]MVW77721.1 hypothetical protein [Bordetella sp. 02P26C-1]
MLRKTLFALGICFALSGCETLSGSTGDKFSPTALRQNIKIGVSTPDDIRAIYGRPDYVVDGPNGPDYWAYDVDDTTNSMIQKAVSFIPVYGAGEAARQVGDDRDLSIYFQNNRVTSYSLSNSRPK